MMICTWVLVINSISDEEVFCSYTDQPIKIDGHLHEWKPDRAKTIQVSSHNSKANATIRTLWDKQYLYIAFQVKDENLMAKQTVLDHPELYLDDMVEFLLDTRNDKDPCWNEDDIIYHINLLGQKKDDKGTKDCESDPSWNGNADYAIVMKGTINDPRDIDTGYNVEIRISWEEIGLTPVPGLKIGVNFAVGDEGNLFDWANASPFRSPDVFGNLILKL